jgi:hypothetical protein
VNALIGVPSDDTTLAEHLKFANANLASLPTDQQLRIRYCFTGSEERDCPGWMKFSDFRSLNQEAAAHVVLELVDRTKPLSSD